ncbi:MAG: hypothetical protein AB1427_08610 [Thermodesulfobacteriota bacterium]
MAEDVYKDDLTGRRSEPRSITEQYHCVEFQIYSIGSFYQFKIWDISNKGMCILVKENSAVMNYIKIDDVIEMKYYPRESSATIEGIKTKIRHITKGEQGRFKGHYLVGLSILDKFGAV